MGRSIPGVSRRRFVTSAAGGGLAAGLAARAGAAAAGCALPPGYRRSDAPLQVRRVVTTHDAAGRSTVMLDETIARTTSARTGHSDALVWTSPVPADNDDATDGATLPPPYQSVFRVARYAPGVAPRNHATQTIDYAVVLSGQIDMELDTGPVTLRAGDVLVQRATMHNWVNRGREPCVIAFILIEGRARAGGVRS